MRLSRRHYCISSFQQPVQIFTIRMAAIFERNSEAGFLFSSMIEFINLWKTEKEGSIKIECKKGRANLSFTCNLGHPDAEHLHTHRHQQGKVKSKSATRRARDRARAERFQATAAPAPTVSPVPPSTTPVSSQFPQTFPQTLQHSGGFHLDFRSNRMV